MKVMTYKFKMLVFI